MGNWFTDKNERGLVFGLWTCHQYIGDIAAEMLRESGLRCDTAEWRARLRCNDIVCVRRRVYSASFGTGLKAELIISTKFWDQDSQCLALVALYYFSIASKANRAFFLIKSQGTFLKAGLEFSTEKINGKSKHRKKSEGPS